MASVTGYSWIWRLILVTEGSMLGILPLVLRSCALGVGGVQKNDTWGRRLENGKALIEWLNGRIDGYGICPTCLRH